MHHANMWELVLSSGGGGQEQYPGCFRGLFGKRYPGFRTAMFVAKLSISGWRRLKGFHAGDLKQGNENEAAFTYCWLTRWCDWDDFEMLTGTFMSVVPGKQDFALPVVLSRDNELVKLARSCKTWPLGTKDSSQKKKAALINIRFLNLHVSCMCLMTGKPSSLWKQPCGVTYIFLHSGAQTSY